GRGGGRRRRGPRARPRGDLTLPVAARLRALLPRLERAHVRDPARAVRRGPRRLPGPGPAADRPPVPALLPGDARPRRRRDRLRRGVAALPAERVLACLVRGLAAARRRSRDRPRRGRPRPFPRTSAVARDRRGRDRAGPALRPGVAARRRGELQGGPGASVHRLDARLLAPREPLPRPVALP